MRSGRFLCALVGALVLSGCQLTANVTVTMNADGSGVVAIDLLADADLLAKAPSAVGDLRLDDARRAGWEVTGPAPADGGASSLRLAKPFQSAGEAAAILAEINGPQGPLRDIEISTAVSFARVDITVNGALQWEGGMAAFSDSALTNLLGRTPLEQEVTAAGVAPEDALELTFAVKLPGQVTGNGELSDDGTMTWTPVLAGGVRTDVDAHGAVVDRGARSAQRTEHLARSALAVYVGVIVLCLLGVLLVILRRRSTASARHTPSA